MTTHQPLLIDFETQSEVSINNPDYTIHESTKILCMSWGFRGGEGHLYWAGEPVPQEIIDHIKSGGMVGASYARFDREIWDLGVFDFDFPATDFEQWFCTQAQARTAGLPSSLDNSARAAGINQRKTASGKGLITKCCIPPFSEDPQDYADLGSYCLQDWVVMDEVARVIPDLTDDAQCDYLANERINNRGIKVDLPLVIAAQKYAIEERDAINKQISYLSSEPDPKNPDGDWIPRITKHTQYARLTKYFIEIFEESDNRDALKLMSRYKTDEATGKPVKKYSTDKEVRTNLLDAYYAEELDLDNEVVELIELMNDAGGTAVAKYEKMEMKADPVDHRVRGILRYAGAPSTLRYTSLTLQVHNMRRDAFDYDKAEFIIKQILKGEELKDTNGEKLNVMDTLARLLRAAIIPEDNHILVVNDWSSVESRMTAYLAGDERKLDVFRSGQDVYCYAAEGIYGKKITKKENPSERDVGKVTDLACGFLGGHNALMSMARKFKINIATERAKQIVEGYRLKHQKIVKYGDMLMLAAKKAVKNPGQKIMVGSVSQVSYMFNEEDGALYCTLPDGKTKLRYPECRLEFKPAPWDKSQKIEALTALKASKTPKATAKEWARHGLWRGLLLENIVQGSCAILLKDAIFECQESNLKVIFHVHDEIICETEISKADHCMAELQEIMEMVPEWAEGLPLEAEPELMKRYGK